MSIEALLALFFVAFAIPMAALLTPYIDRKIVQWVSRR